MKKEILQAIMAGYALPWNGEHGLRHWGRVLENGTRLAVLTGADVEVVQWFALFHDCRRTNQGIDHGHGQRGGSFAATLHQVDALGLTDAQFERLREACDHHTGGGVEAHPTIQTCWDADRLDLGRVGIAPDPQYLCTSAARDPAMIAWSEERARSNHRAPVIGTWYGWLGETESP